MMATGSALLSTTAKQSPRDAVVHSTIAVSVACEDQAHEESLQLLARCLRGDADAWKQLVHRYERRIFGFCYHFTGDPTEAQDLTQEIFLKVFQGLRLYRPDKGDFEAWLLRLARNHLTDYYRKQKRRTPPEPLEAHAARLASSTSAYERSDSSATSWEIWKLLEAALKELPTELKEVLILRDIQQLPYQVIAQALEIPEGTVKSRLNRARILLVKTLRRMGATL